MTKPIFSDDDRRRIHDEIDAMLDVPGLEGLTLALAAYHEKGIKVMSVGKGNVCVEDFIRTDLRLLADKCREMGTPNSLAMLPALDMCIKYIEHLYDQSDDDGVTIMDTTATEVRQ